MSLTMSTDELVRLVVDEIWNCGELEVADELFTGDYINHGGLISDLIRGPEAVKLSVVLYRRAFPDFQITVDEVTTDKGAIVLRWMAHGRAPLMDGITLRKRGLRGITRCRLRSGKIAGSWTVWDARAGLVRLASGRARARRGSSR